MEETQHDLPLSKLSTWLWNPLTDQATRTSLRWFVSYFAKLYRCGYKVKLHRSCLTTGCSESFTMSPCLTTNYEQQYIDNTASSCVVTSEKNDLAKMFDDFAVIFDNFAPIFENFVMILHIQRWLYNDFAAILYNFKEILRRFFDDSAYTTISQRLYNNFE